MPEPHPTPRLIVHPGFVVLVVALWLGGLALGVVAALAHGQPLRMLDTTVHAGTFLLTYLIVALMHEIGHGFVARALGLPWRSLSLGMGFWVSIGTATPAQRLAVGMAGPTAHLAMVAMALGLQHIPPPLAGNAVADAGWLLLADLMLNLLPIGRSDGARILRAAIDLTRAGSPRARHPEERTSTWTSS